MNPTDPSAPPRELRGADPVGGRLLFQAVRRHPVLFTLIVLATLGAGFGLWRALPLPRTTGAVVFQVAAQPPAVLEPPADSRGDFLAYRGTQAALVRKRQVLAATLDQPEVRDLAAVQEQADPVGWLDHRLNVDFRVGPEFMRVSLEGDDPQEVVAILGALSRSYLAEVDERENGQRRRRLAQLESVQAEQRDRQAKVQKEIDAIAVRLGSKDATTLALADQMAREELTNANREVAEIDAQLQVLPRPDAPKPKGEVTVPPSMIEDRLRKDSTLIQLEGELTKARARLAATERSYKPGVTTPAVTKARDEVQAAEDDLNRARDDLRPRVEAALREELTEERQRKAAQDADTVARLTRRKDALAARTREIRGKMAEANRARIELENLKQETAHTDKFAGTVADEAERLRLELGAPPRVTMSEEPFLAAGLEGNRRLKITLAGMLAVFVAGFGLLVLYEHRTRPVTRARDAADGLGLRLLGTVPALGARGGRYNADPHRALAEAIDTTRTMVLYGAADRRVRTLLVTSAVDGEGKTSLAGHLAISLTRAGYRTLLVDGDVQAPSTHALFDLPAAPGLCEVLRGEATVDQAIRPTPLPGLSVLPAGAWDLIARQALVGHRWKTVKADLEAGYDFVVIDSGPVLLVSDSLLLARDADGVLLSVLLDVSRVSSVEETRDRLRTVGANVLGVVVNGVVTPSYRAVQTRGPAAPARLAEAGLPA